MPKFYAVTEREKAIIEEVMRQVRGQIVNSPSRPSGEQMFTEGFDAQASDVYIAKPLDADGIPGLTPSGETLTGTGSSAYDQPGYADCDIFTVYMDQGIPYLRPIEGQTRKVYNVSQGTVSKDWLPVARTKFGHWLALSGGGGGGDTIIVGKLTGTLDAPGDFLEVPTTVTGQEYLVTGSLPQATGDEITLTNYDPDLSGTDGDYFIAVRKGGLNYLLHVQCPQE